MRRTNRISASIDWITVVLYLLMVLLGWLNIYAAVYNEQHQSIFDISQRYGKQLIWIIMALIIGFSVFLVDEKFFSLFAYIFYGITIFLLMAVLVAGKEVNGAKSWFALGSFHLQPSEFAKLGTALALAKYMSKFNFSLRNSRHLISSLLVVFAPALFIMLQPDMGSVLVYFALLIVLYREGLSPFIPVTGVALAFFFIITLLYSSFAVLAILIGIALVSYYGLSKSFKPTFYGAIIVMAIYLGIQFAAKYAGIGIDKYMILLIALSLTAFIAIFSAFKNKIKYVGIILLLLVASIGYTYSVNYVFEEVLSDHQQTRINVLLGLEEDPQGAGYNIKQSKIAIGSGGFAGKGYLQGTQTKYRFVPEQSTDFIFCTVGEEWGFLGTSVIIGLFVFLLLRIVIIAERQKINFNRIFAYSVFSIFFIHFVINIGMTIGLFPVIGIPLPFFSYGGSSLWSFTILLAVLLKLDAARVNQLSR